jgi:hypothetical protein
MKWEGLRRGGMRYNPTGFTVRTKLKWRPDVVPRKRLHKHARPDKEKGRPDEATLLSGQPEHRPDASHTKKKF